MTDYGARVVMHLACTGSSSTIREIAEARALPAPFVRRLVAHLVRAGLVATVRGQKGGLTLARPPAAISLLDVVHAIEGPIALNHCLDDAHGCPFSGACPVQTAWATATEALEQSLAAQTFDVLSRSSAGHVSAHVQLHRRAPRTTKKE